MAVTKESDGSQTATVTTEHTLATIITDKVFQLYVDINALAAGEYVEIKLKTMPRALGTTRTLAGGIFSWRDAGISPIVVSVPFMSDEEAVFTLKQLNGTGRAFPWAVKTP